MTVETAWRGRFTNEEANWLHAQPFDTRVHDASEWDWVGLVKARSLGWAPPREAHELVGFVNLAWDGLVHAWLQDTMVAADARRSQGIAQELVGVATQGAREVGCE